MKFKLSDLWRWEGMVGRGTYLVAGTYWKLWSDHIIHRIHLRVLSHVKNLSEQDG